MRGRTIELPIKGTVRKPELVWKDTVSGLTDVLTTGGILEELGLGSKDAEPGAEDEGPAALLDQADRLWEAGRRVEAAAIYTKIRADHRVSLTYALNRDKVKRRAKYQE